MEEKRKFFMILAKCWIVLFILFKKVQFNCYVFEPSFSNLKLIQNNIALNNLEKNIDNSKCNSL